MKTPHAISIGLSLIAAAIFCKDNTVKSAYAYNNLATKSDVIEALNKCIHLYNFSGRLLETRCKEVRQICDSGLASNFHQVPQRFPRLIFNFGDPIMTCILGSGFQAKLSTGHLARARARRWLLSDREGRR